MLFIGGFVPVPTLEFGREEDGIDLVALVVNLSRSGRVTTLSSLLLGGTNLFLDAITLYSLFLVLLTTFGGITKPLPFNYPLGD